MNEGNAPPLTFLQWIVMLCAIGIAILYTLFIVRYSG